MARVSDNPTMLTRQDALTLGLVGVVISNHPERIRKLLREYDISTSDKPTGAELSEKVTRAILDQGVSFHRALAGLISEHLGFVHRSEEQDSYVAAIIGAVGAIAGALGNIGNKKQKKQEASRQTFNAMMAYQQRKQEQAAQVAAAAKLQAGKMALLKGFGILVVTGLVGWVVVKKMNKAPMLGVTTKQ